MRESGNIQPAQQTANVGTNATFWCNSRTEPEWYFLSISDTKYHDRQYVIFLNQSIISTNYQLVFNPVKVKHKGTYICIGKYLKNDRIFISIAYLNVYGKFWNEISTRNVPIYQIISTAQEHIDPSFQLMNEKDEAIISCHSNSIPTWLFHNKNYNTPVMKSSKNYYYIYISHVKPENEGRYICSGTTLDNAHFEAYSDLSVRGACYRIIL